MDAGVGFRDHSGWAIAVVVALDGSAPKVLARERLALLPASLPRQPYHAVAEQGAGVAVIDEVLAAAAAGASAALAQLRAGLPAGGRLICAGVGGDPAPLPPLAAILRSHALLHAAEGQLYREVLAESAVEAGLATHRYRWKELESRAPAELGLPPPAVAAALAAPAKALGPPWTKDHREAMLLAWLALSAQKPA